MVRRSTAGMAVPVTLPENGSLSGLVELMKSLIDQALADRELEPKPVPLIYSTINKIMAALEPIAKAHQHDQEHFWFRKIDEMCAKLQPLFREHGLVTVPEVLESTRLENPVRTADGGEYVQFFTTMKVRWHLYAMDGSFWPHDCVTMGEGMSDAHFSTNAALTMAYKAMLTETFCIPIFGADDPEETIFERSSSSYQAPAPSHNEVPPPGPGSLFDSFDPPEPQAAGERKATRTRRKKDEGPQMVAVGGAQLPADDEIPFEPAPVKEDPIGVGLRRILMAQLNANGIPLPQLFLKYEVKWEPSGDDEKDKETLDAAWKATGITQSRMNEVTVWINSPKE